MAAAVAMAVILGSAWSPTALGQFGTDPPRRLDPAGQPTQQYNSEWVESTSPIPSGGVVTTTYFPASGQSSTTIRQPVTTMDAQRPQVAGVSYNEQFQSGSIGRPSPGLAPIPSGSGGYLVPTVSYVPMNAATMASYQTPVYNAAQTGAPFSCATCQTPWQTQPTQFQPAMMQPPAAGQIPVLPPTAGGVYGPIQGQMAGPGFYPQAPAQPAGWFGGHSGQSGYRSLVPRSLPAGTYIGQGWLGQPKAFVNNQPLRNFMRYLIVP